MQDVAVLCQGAYGKWVTDTASKHRAVDSSSGFATDSNSDLMASTWWAMESTASRISAQQGKVGK